ncbi:hypothetical protein JTT07_13900 [Clostridium botulinum]|nr:hypothetical protein [Clostridium botulinum]MCS4524637.1 hypothetical protein [Clostridium botulinum]
MDIAVIGSNMVDLISYIDRMPKEGETLEALDFKMGFGVREQTRPLQLQD